VALEDAQGSAALEDAISQGLASAAVNEAQGNAVSPDAAAAALARPEVATAGRDRSFARPDRIRDARRNRALDKPVEQVARTIH
jgi:hypothetical protein